MEEKGKQISINPQGLKLSQEEINKLVEKLLKEKERDNKEQRYS